MIDFRKRVDRILKHSMREFGEEVTFYPKSGGVYVARCVFDNDYQSVDVETEQVISSNQPAIGVNLNDIKFKARQGDVVVVRGQKFYVHDKREDGQGGATFLLHKVDADEKDRDTRVR